MKLGTNDIGSVYLGTNAVQKVYLGANEVWSAVDPDAQAFFDRVDTAGGTLSATEKGAVNTLVVQMKSDGIWTKMKAIYPMVGASAAACAQNLKSSSFTGTFTSGWTFASTGVTPNGTSAYMDTGLTPNSTLSLNSTHISAYNRSNIASPSIMGASDASYSNGIYITPRYSTSLSNQYVRLNSNSGGGQFISKSDGYWLASRIVSSQFKVWQSNTLKVTENISSSGLTSNKIYLGAANLHFLEYGAYQIAFASIGDGLTDGEASDLYTAVQAFQTTLSRNV